eukprot:TRINITY_DN7098_c0_g1_i3.p10 TRINITY_DN7098_c0_g1~~TRINITY_DN7098_c0_g1_i3.p10  ORF type:complete len:108 (-),score=13.69 TRINITY_DN7098_c0_g1_i3:1068-1391(-)
MPVVFFVFSACAQCALQHRLPGLQDRSFTFVLKTPPASKLILKAAGISKGSGTPHKVLASNTEDQLKEIAEIKLPDLNARDIEAAMNVIQGTCRNICVAVEGREHRA